jgi:FtsH-binding integral membrane protein
VTEPGPGRAASGYTPPALPPVRTGLWHIAVPGTVIWLAGFVVLLFFIPTLQANGAMVWLWTCLAGFILGLLGLSVYALQRRAARLGRRSANQMALDESI